MDFLDSFLAALLSLVPKQRSPSLLSAFFQISAGKHLLHLSYTHHLSSQDTAGSSPGFLNKVRWVPVVTPFVYRGQKTTLGKNKTCNVASRGQDWYMGTRASSLQ